MNENFMMKKGQCPLQCHYKNMAADLESQDNEKTKAIQKYEAELAIIKKQIQEGMKDEDKTEILEKIQKDSEVKSLHEQITENKSILDQVQGEKGVILIELEDTKTKLQTLLSEEDANAVISELKSQINQKSAELKVISIKFDKVDQKLAQLEKYSKLIAAKNKSLEDQYERKRLEYIGMDKKCKELSSIIAHQRKIVAKNQKEEERQMLKPPKLKPVFPFLERLKNLGRRDEHIHIEDLTDQIEHRISEVEAEIVKDQKKNEVTKI